MAKPLDTEGLALYDEKYVQPILKKLPKNLVRFPFSDAEYKSAYGLTYELIPDEQAIIVNGTSTAQYSYYFLLETDKNKQLPVGNYIISAETEGEADSGWTVYINKYNGTTLVENVSLVNTQGEDKAFTVDYDGYDSLRLGFTVYKTDQTFNNFKVKVMIRDASDPNRTYQKYVASNEVLTYEKAGINQLSDVIARNFNAGPSSNTFIRGTGTSSEALYRTYTFPMTHELKINEQYIVSFDISNVENFNGSKVLGIRFGGLATQGNSSDFNADLTKDHFEHKFTIIRTTAGNNLYMYLNQDETSETATVTISNIMIRKADDLDDTYAPYAMTNPELTEKVSGIITDPFVTSRTYVSSSLDANDLECGFTRMSNANANLPVTPSGVVWFDILTVRQSNNPTEQTWNYGFQLAIQTTSNSDQGDTYVRACNWANVSGTYQAVWSEWKKLNS